MDQALDSRIAKMETKLRRAELLKETAQLVELTKRFRGEVADGSIARAEGERRLDEISKLARSVRSRLSE